MKGGGLMGFWKSDLIAGLETEIFNDVSKGQYKVGNTWSDCTTVSSGTADGRKYFTFEVPSSVSGTITGLRLIDSSSNVLAEKTVNITKTATRAFSFRIKYRIVEREEE